MNPTCGSLSGPQAGWGYPAFYPSLPLCIILKMGHTIDFIGADMGRVEMPSLPLPCSAKPQAGVCSVAGLDISDRNAENGI